MPVLHHAGRCQHGQYYGQQHKPGLGEDQQAATRNPINQHAHEEREQQHRQKADKRHHAQAGL